MGLVYLDSCVLIYYVEDHPQWRSMIEQAFETALGNQFAVSPLVKFECLVSPLKDGNQALEQRYQGFFERLVSLDMPEIVYTEAARLRARFGLKTPDALHLACAQHHKCEALWTNDNRLVRASLGMARSLVELN